jgi:serine/threonine-protein kinase
MISTTVNKADSFLANLGEYALLPTAGLERARAFRQAFASRGADELAAFLVEQKMLTRFQADLLLAGEGSKLILSIFTLVDVIGTGSMGTVYRARSSRDGNWYAVKIVPRRNVINLTSITAKVEALKQVRHPRVSAMVHVGALGDRVYMVWPMIEGGEKLDAIVARQGKLAPRQAAQVALQAAMGLEAYHQHGLFHGLLKPTDILIGSDRRVRILDFGVGFLLTCERGKSLLDTTTNNKALTRGVDCASPEAILDPLNRTPAGDQYSLGCILYFCLTGQYPFPESNPVKKMLAHQFNEPTPVRKLVPECPPKLATLVHRLLAKRPEERYAKISEVVAELQVVTSDSRGIMPMPAAARTPVTPSTPIPGPAVVPSARRTTIKGEEPRADKVKKTAARQSAGEEAPSSGRFGWWLTVAGALAGAVAGVATWMLMRN